MPRRKPEYLNLSVWVAGLGYFVDMYDLSIFGIVRLASLRDLGVTDPAELFRVGAQLYNWQMTGMLAGGLLWGILGDRLGRLSVLFGSILLYSLANLANAWVDGVAAYRALRFVAGIGLAGELGAAVTLVSEILPRERRGIGTAIVASLGLLGVIAASLTGSWLPWRTTYVVGGLLGLLLLLARLRMAESPLFLRQRRTTAKGDLGLLLSRARLPTLLHCVAIGVPLYFCSGVLVTFSPELASALALRGEVSVATATLFFSVGLAVGDLASGFWSQRLKSRKRAIRHFLAGATALIACAFAIQGQPVSVFYGLCLLLGLSVGYWAVLITLSAELFGTNLRATVATSVPNFVRGSLVVLLSALSVLRTGAGLSWLTSAALIGGACCALAFWSLSRVRETFGRDLDFTEAPEPLRT